MGSRGDGRVWAQGRWEGVGAAEVGGCANRGDGSVVAGKMEVWEQERWEDVGAKEMG